MIKRVLDRSFDKRVSAYAAPEPDVARLPPDGAVKAPRRALNMRSAFLAGCVTLVLPGLAASGHDVVQAWTAWRSAQVVTRETRAVAEAMRASAALMLERGELQAQGLAVMPDLQILARAAAATDLALAHTRSALLEAGASTASINQVHEILSATRVRAMEVVRNRASFRAPSEQFARLIESLDAEMSRAERAITLASPSTGVLVGLARGSNDLRAIAGRRGQLLSLWTGGQIVSSAQKDELLILTGRLAGAWDRIQRGIAAARPTPGLVEAVKITEKRFFVQEEPWYRELAKTAVAGAEPPLSHAQYRRWTKIALGLLVPVREALISEASAQSEGAVSAALRRMLVSLGLALLSVCLVMAAVVALLRGLVDPVRRITAATAALANGDITASDPVGSRLTEVAAMEAAVAVFRDNLVSLHERETELRGTNLRFGAALENMSQGLTMYDAREHLTVFNRRFCEIVGLPPEQIKIGMTFREVVALSVEAGNFPGRSVEQAYADRQGFISRLDASGQHDELTGERAIAVRYQPMAGRGWVATYEDVTERRAAEACIAHMAHHDGLTGLANRVLFREEMDRALVRAKRGDAFAVLCLDLDRFKAVNDTLGHSVGDTLLKSVAERLRGCLRDTDILARLGGDEFVILQIAGEQPVGATALARRIIETIGSPFDLDGHRVDIGTSIGIAVAPDDGIEADGLLKSADMALYQAKGDGRGAFRFFEAGMNAKMQFRRGLEIDLRQALGRGEFTVHFQPLVELEAGEVSGFEALLRWEHPTRGQVPPDQFIPLAEELGLIGSIGAWVLREACAAAATWPAQLSVAVNLSPVQFRNRQLVLDVVGAVSASGLAPSRLELEITETAMLFDTDTTLATLHQLKELGVRIAMDDFGTGYSSLSYLRKFPFDKIKIDRSFVRDLSVTEGSLAIIRAVTRLAADLGMVTTAEGVETHEQLATLRAQGCTQAQGYLFSQARPANEALGLVRSIGRSMKDAA
jgi:diguanylate cyclase (GGDEF)-like protein